MPGGWRKRIQSPYFATGNPETEEMTTLYAPGMLGCVAEFDQGGIAGPPNICAYQLVLQAAAISGVVGQVMIASNAQKGLFTVTNASNVNRGTLVGICRKVVVTAASYIWVAKKGDLNVLYVDAPTVAPDATGLPAFASGTAGKADSVALNTAVAPSEYIGATLAAQDGGTKLALTRINIIDAF